MYTIFSEEELNTDSYEDIVKMYSGHLNCFAGYFPQGNIPHQKDDALAELGSVRKMFRDYGFNEGDIKTKKYHLSGNPTNITHAEFFEDIAHAVEEVGMQMKDVSEAINPLTGACDITLEQWEHAYNTLRPIYIAMRKKGYSREDLWM